MLGRKAVESTDIEIESHFCDQPSTSEVTIVDQAIPLSDLSPGQSARVGRIVGFKDEVHRLRELGLRDGTKVRMFRPGNPCIFHFAGTKLCLRCDHRLSVYVLPEHV